jgi:hypothetical protein
MVSPASSSGYPFGSKILPNQSDTGRPLFPLQAETTMAFWDIGQREQRALAGVVHCWCGIEKCDSIQELIHFSYSYVIKQ